MTELQHTQILFSISTPGVVVLILVVIGCTSMEDEDDDLMNSEYTILSKTIAVRYSAIILVCVFLHMLKLA